MEIKVTNTSLTTENGECKLVVYGRTKDLEAKKVKISGIKKSFYAPTEKFDDDKENELISQSEVTAINHDTDKVGWKGQEMSEVILHPDENHWGVRNVAESSFDHEDRFAADIFMKNIFRIEAEVYSGLRLPAQQESISIEDVEPVEIKDFRTRIAYIDIETDDRGEFVKDGSRPILSIVAQDSYTEEVVGFFWTGSGRTIEDCFPNGRPEKLDRLEWATSEKDILKKFSNYVREHNQDMWTGWNFEDFDAPYILNRFDKLNLDKSKLSRDGYCKISNNNQAFVGGRVMYDLQQAWLRTKWKEPDSKSLDNVAFAEIGKEKVEHVGMGYHEMWEHDPELLMNYNSVDVTLCKELNEELGTLSFWRTIGDVVGVDWDETRANSDYIRMFCLRKLDEKGLVGPTTNYGRPKEDYDGGFVFDAHKGRVRNVVGLDLASLYPNSMAMANLSPEMRVTEEEAEKLKAARLPVCQTPTGSYYRLDQDGIFKELVDDAIGLKESAKTARNNATPGTPEHDKLAEEYMAKKTVTNSVYGVLGWEPFFLYDRDCAESTTLLGQAVTKRTAKYMEEIGATVIYGDTDSNYVKFDDGLSQEETIEKSLQVCDDLNKTIYPEFAEEFGIPASENRWDIEPEVLMETFFQSGAKKFYAYKAIWEDGHWLDEPDYNYKGYSFKKSSSSQLTRELGYEMMDMILDGKENDEISKLISDTVDMIDNNPDTKFWEMIGISQGLGKEIHIDCECENCYNWSATGHHPKDAHPRGAYFTNILTGKAKLEKGSKPKRVYLEPTISVGEGEQHEKVDVICFENYEDLPESVRNKLKVDTTAMVEKLIENPFRDIVDTIGIDIECAIRGQVQQGFEAFL